MIRPEFTIVAGPNVAGKINLPSLYVKTVPFDGDNMALQLHKVHPDWPEEWVSGTVAQELQNKYEEEIIIVHMKLQQSLQKEKVTIWMSREMV